MVRKSADEHAFKRSAITASEALFELPRSAERARGSGAGGLRSWAVAKKRPTSDDRVEAMQIALSGIAGESDPVDLASNLQPLHPKNNTFPGEVLLGLAADAIELSGATRENPIGYEGIRDRYLPELVFKGKSQHRKSHFALRAAAMIRAGVEPDLLDEVIWWDSDDLFVWSLYALIIYARLAAERTSTSVAEVCEQLAARHDIDLAGLA